MNNDLISRSDALDAVDARHEELLHDTEYRKKHCQIDLLGVKKHILAIPSANVLKPTEVDLISREALKKAISYHCKYLHDNTMELEDILGLIDNAPTVDGIVNTIEERPQGKWIYHTDGYIAFYTCSKCNGFGDIQDKFCKHCGARMERTDDVHN